MGSRQKLRFLCKCLKLYPWQIQEGCHHCRIRGIGRWRPCRRSELSQLTDNCSQPLQFGSPLQLQINCPLMLELRRQCSGHRKEGHSAVLFLLYSHTQFRRNYLNARLMKLELHHTLKILQFSLFSDGSFPSKNVPLTFLADSLSSATV